MTIVSGRTYAVESFHEFREALDVSWHELAQALGENHQREMVRTANEGRAKQSGKTEAKSVKDLEEAEIAEHIEEWASFTDTRLMKPVLEARDQRYTFVVDGRLPGVESFFEHNLDGEMENLAATIRADLGL